VVATDGYELTLPTAISAAIQSCRPLVKKLCRHADVRIFERVLRA